MFQYYLKICYAFFFYIIIQVKHGGSQENDTTEAKTFLNMTSIAKCEIKLCSCIMLQKLGDVYCEDHNETAISELNMTNINLKEFPSKIFLGFTIKKLIFDDPDVTVYENVFEGMVSLEIFEVKRSKIKIIPDFRAVKDSLYEIVIQSSALTSLEGENLQNLTKVFELNFRNNSIRFIEPDVFKGTENVRGLDLSLNLLTFIPPTLLDPMKKLYSFNAMHNNLQHADNLFSVTMPYSINLSINNITDANSILHIPKKKVQELALTNVSHCETYDYVPDYKILFNLDYLDLAFNTIKEGPKLLFPCLQDNIWGGTLYTVKLAYLTFAGNQIQSLNTFFRYSQIHTIFLAKNEIQYLTAEDFISVRDTWDLHLLKNQIRRIDTDTFKPIRNYLGYLDLSFNSIRSLNGSLRYLANLRKLILGVNLIETFAPDEFTGLTDLFYLDLQSNRIKALELLQQSPRLQILIIRHNNITGIEPYKLPNIVESLYLEDNPLKCDCHLMPFIYWLQSKKVTKVDVFFCLQPELGNRLQNQTNCPDMCRCGCTVDAVPFMYVDCSSKNLTVVPKFSRSDLTNFKANETSSYDVGYNFVVIQNIDSSSYLKDRISGINLEYNSLESLDATQLPPNLTHLYLSSNKLKWLPDDIFDNQVNLQQESLSGNPWNCDCSSLKFKKWLTSNNDIIEDIDNVRCGINNTEQTNLFGRALWNLTDLDLCPMTKDSISVYWSLSVIGLVLLAFGLIGKILYTKYNLNIKVFLYSHGFTFVKEEDLDYDKDFDAFISFSNNDGELVTKEIISEIEKRDPTIRLCIHYRHFLPGEFIYDNIIRAVQTSKKTILFLSSNFLESDWCILEFRLAHIQALDDRVHRVIVIKFGDLPKEIDPAIKAYLETTTYLTWGEKKFWEKLLYVLPKGSSSTNSAPKNTVDIEAIFNYSTSQL